ncbi:hypothetical protein GCM10009850_080540 [Nonomuraea monospora]|uniref:Sporulation protein n=1 Tax=Nonomuraea monospora TaxID=568818 RepID=A0ABP5PNZ1_9ACTN
MPSTFGRENDVVVFKRMLGGFGAGGPAADTVLTTPRIQPGGTLSGEVRLAGGDFDAEIQHIALELVAQVEIERGAGAGEFSRTQVAGPFVLRRGENRSVLFSIPVPWETPISEIFGRHLPGMALGVRTEVAAADAVHRGEPDLVAVVPLPSQLRVLQAFPQLGFHFTTADLQAGHLDGVRQDLPFHQAIELARGHGAVWLSFVAGPYGIEVVVEAGKRAGRFSAGHDEALRTDWPGEIDRWLAGLTCGDS